MSEARAFAGDRYFLSNFFTSPIKIDYENISYVLATGEHVFHGMKVAAAPALTSEQKHAFLTRLASDPHPGHAKKEGRTIQIDPARWDAMSYRCMERVVELKFTQHPELAERLLATGDEELVERNTWGDRLWGVDATTGEGKNQLGQILMAYREQLRNRPYRILITGSRGWTDQARMWSVLDEVSAGKEKVLLVSGHARGADSMAEAWARSRGHQVEVHPADWNQHGNRAGYVRNQKMADLGADIVVAFRVGDSPGTTMMMKLVEKQGLALRTEQA